MLRNVIYPFSEYINAGVTQCGAVRYFYKAVKKSCAEFVEQDDKIEFALQELLRFTKYEQSPPFDRLKDGSLQSVIINDLIAIANSDDRKFQTSVHANSKEIHDALVQAEIYDGASKEEAEHRVLNLYPSDPFSPQLAEDILRFASNKKITKDMASIIIIKYVKAAGYGLDRFGNYVLNDARFHWKTNQVNHQTKSGGQWTNVNIYNLLDLAITLLRSAEVMLGTGRVYAEQKEDRAEKKVVAKVKSQNKAKREVAAIGAIKALYREMPDVVLRSMHKEKLPDATYEHMRKRYEEITESFVENGIPADETLVSVDAPSPVGLFNRQMSYLWIEDGFTISLTPHKHESALVIEIGGESMMTSIDPTSGQRNYSSLSRQGKGYLSGYIYEAKDRTFRGVLFMLSGPNGLKIAHMWCRMMRGFNIPQWAALGLSDQGDKFVRSLVKRGSLEIVGTSGSSMVLRCVL